MRFELPRLDLGPGLQNNPTHLSGAEAPRPTNVVRFVRVHRCLEREVMAIGSEGPAVVGGLEVMLGSSVVEPGCAFQHEPHLAPYNPHQTNQQVSIGSDLGFIDRHEVDNFAHSVGCHEP